ERADAERIAVRGKHRQALAHVLRGGAVHDGAESCFELPGALSGRDHERAAAEARHPGLERGERAQRRIEEHEPEDAARERLRFGMRLEAAREREPRDDLVTAEVCKVEEALHARVARHSDASASASGSTCCSSSTYGGSSRSTCGSPLVPVRMSRASSAAWMSRAGRFMRSPSRKPSPWKPVTGPTAQRLRIYADTRRTFASRSSDSIASITASMTAPAIGPPPKVVPSASS